MKIAVRLIVVCAIILGAPFSLHAQTVSITEGHLDIALTEFEQVLKEQGVRSVMQTNVKGDFQITSGTIDLATGLGRLVSAGSFDLYDEDTMLQLKAMTFITDGVSPHIDADVVLNGVDLGESTVFQVIHGPAYPLPLPAGSFKNPSLRFKFDQGFWTSFVGMFRLSSSFTAPETAGDFAVRFSVPALTL